MPKQGEATEVSIKSKLTIGNLHDKRNIEVQLGNYAQFTTVLEEKEDAYTRALRVDAVRALAGFVAHYCEGELHGKPVAELANADGLSDEEIIVIATGMVRLSDDEAKKSAKSSVQLQVVAG